MTTPQEPVYALMRGSEQVVRVNLIQYTWFNTLGYLLHPEIPKAVTKIADVATATGLWLCELNAERTQLQKSSSDSLVDYEALDGYDISAQSFLPDNQKPSKVVLKALDAREEAPAELKGKYDVVHIRLLAPGIYDGEPSAIIKHCYDLLRPGGYLQWEEFDLLDYKVVKKDGTEADSSHLRRVADTFKGGNPKDWIRQLPKTLEGHGFVVKAADRMREPEWHRTNMTHQVCSVAHEISRARLDKVGPPGAGEKLRGVIKAGLEENLNEGSYISSLFQIVVAQKPERGDDVTCGFPSV